MSKSQEKKSTFSQNIFKKIAIFQNVQIKKKRYIRSDFRGSCRHFDYLFTCLGLIVKLLVNYLQHHLESTKIIKIMSTLNFETLLAAKS